MKPRLGVSAVILRDDAILLVEFDDETGLHYNFPGGGVEPDESVYDAIRREVREECHAEVESVGAVLMIWEYIGAKENYKYGDAHKVNLLFPCTLKADSEPHFPPNPDLHQTGIRWVKLNELHTVSLIPDVAERLLALLKQEAPQPIKVETDL